MIISFNSLPFVRKKLQKQKIIFTSGSFDMLHTGHVLYLKRLKKLGDALVVAIDSDSRVKERKGNLRPVFGEKERALIVDSLSFVDFVVITPPRFVQKDMPTIQVIKRLRPDFYVSIEAKWKNYKKELAHYGTKLKLVKRANTKSTSQIIRKVRSLKIK